MDRGTRETVTEKDWTIQEKKDPDLLGLKGEMERKESATREEKQRGCEKKRERWQKRVKKAETERERQKGDNKI